jgi:hypothetical protein
MTPNLFSAPVYILGIHDRQQEALLPPNSSQYVECRYIQTADSATVCGREIHLYDLITVYPT